MDFRKEAERLSTLTLQPDRQNQTEQALRDVKRETAAECLQFCCGPDNWRYGWEIEKLISERFGLKEKHEK